MLEEDFRTFMYRGLTFAFMVLVLLTTLTKITTTHETVTGDVSSTWQEGRFANDYYVSVDVVDENENVVFEVCNRETWAEFNEGQTVTITVSRGMFGTFLIATDPTEEVQP